MPVRTILRSAVLSAGLLLAACGGGGSDSSTATPTPSAVDTTVTAPVSTEAATTTASTAPPTTLPPTIDLNTLPGLLAVITHSCAPEPFVFPENVPSPFVCTLKPNGTDVQVVSQEGEEPVALAFTRDGTHLWYHDPNTHFGYVIDLTTGAHRKREGNDPFTGGISPDGQFFLFTSSANYEFAIAHTDGSDFPDGSITKSVSDDPHTHLSNASWAPDSVHFAYLSTNDDSGGELECDEVWVGAIDGTPPVKITDFASSPDAAEGCPDSVRWSPTDDRILIHTVGKPSYIIGSLYVIDADGSHLTKLTNGSADHDPNLIYSYNIVGWSPGGDWSPDGKYIMFIVSDGTAYQLAVMNADGSQVTPISAAPLGLTSGFVSLVWALG